MAEKPRHAFASPELHWLNNPPRSSHAFKRTALMLKLLSVPLNQGKRISAMAAHENSSKRSSNLAKSHGRSPKGEGTREHDDSAPSIQGFTLGIASATAVAPIERVYILMQCQNEMIRADRLSTPYKGMIDCFLRTIKYEGVISLWRGNSMNVARLCAIEALLYAFVNLPYKEYIHAKTKESPLWVLPFAMMPATLILCLYPLEYARVRLASDVKAATRLMFSLDSSRKTLRNNTRSWQFSGVSDVYKKTLRLDGIHGLYRGFSVSCIGLLAYYMAATFKASSRKEQRNQKKTKSLAFVVTSLGVSLSIPIVLYPFSTLSRRMMMTSGLGEVSKYRGAVDAFYQIVKGEGVSSLFKGATPYMIHFISKNAVKYWIVSMAIFGLKWSTD